MTAQIRWQRAAPWLAVTGLALVITLAAAAVALAMRNGYDLSELAFLLTTPVAALVGGLVVSRRPANPVGWCILGHALCFSLGEFSRQYALFGLLTQPGALPAPLVFASVAHWIWGLAVVLGFTLWLLVFPDGRLVAPGWRVAVWYVLAVTVTVTALQAIMPGVIETPGIPNPLGIAALATVAAEPFVLIQLLWLSTAIVALASVTVRYRRGTPRERQQIRWPAYAAAVTLALTVLDRFLPLPAPEFVIVLTLGGIWVAIGIAILRHQLFDIDLIIKRTLVYSLVSGVLVAVYFASVVLLQQAFRVLTGQESDLAIVASTLAIAVLFQPVRRRSQAFMDRRFHRRGYDAEAVLAANAAALRDEVDTQQVATALVEAVAGALEPSHVALWVRDEADQERR